MKRILIAILALSLALGLAACKPNVTFNAAADLPAGAEIMAVVEVGQSRGDYYVKAAVGDRSYIFRLAQDFTARAFEPGVEGALAMLDYTSPEDFYSRWYQQAKRFSSQGLAFAFVFAGDTLVSLTDTTQPSPPDGPPQGTYYEELPEGVEYVEEFEWEGDAGEGLSAPEAAVLLFNAVVRFYDYAPGDSVRIAMTGFDFVNDSECYRYRVETPDGTSEHAVDYFKCDVYVLLEDEYKPIYSERTIDDVPWIIHGLDADQAEYILMLTLNVQLDEGMALVYKGEGEVDGQKAFLFDLGTNTAEKFTAEEHYAVTDDGEPWLLDVLTNTWVPAAAG